MPRCKKRSARLAALPSQADCDAMSLLLDAQKELFAHIKPEDKHKTLGKLLNPDELDGVAKLNHAVAYLDDREGYGKLRAELYEGIIEVT